MANNQIITKTMNVRAAETFAESLKHVSQSYVFAAKHTPYRDNSDQDITAPDASDYGTINWVYDNMIFGKAVQDNDVINMAPRYNWSSNTTYAMYDDTDVDLYSKKFYACVNVGSQVHVYKCLYNGGNAESITEPSGTDIDPFETPQDGYIWKYMCTADDGTMRKFSTTDFMPIVANTTVIANATPGAIEVIQVNESGTGYDNYLSGEFGSSADLRIGGNITLYAIGASASSIDDFYNNCLILMTSGDAKDEYRVITDYYVSGGQKIIALDSAFTGTVAATDTFEIYPFVYIFDVGGQKQTNCIARAIVDGSSGNSISKVDILASGSGYRAATAVILQSNVVSVGSNADLRAIISPQGGHGSDPFVELGANYVGVAVKFIGDEDVIPTENDFRTIGLLRDPYYANLDVQIDTTSTIGNFIPDEIVYKYRPVTLPGTVETFSNSTLEGTDTFFDESVKVGDAIIVSDGDTNIFANVIGIADNTHITISSNASFSSNGCTIVLANPEYLGVVTANSSGEIFLSNVSPIEISSSMRLVGAESQCTSIVNAVATMPISINGRVLSNFDYFRQLTRFDGVFTEGLDFEDDETVEQDSLLPYDRPTASFHSIVNDDTLFVTNVRNSFQTNASASSDGVVTGEQSGAQFTISNIARGDLVQDSGEVLFVENLNPITREDDQTETIRLIIEF